jgi:hypothetical protein
MEERSKALRVRVEYFEQNVQQLNSDITGFAVSARKNAQRSASFAQSLKDQAAKEQFGEMQESLLMLASRTETLADASQQVLCGRFESEILMRLARIQSASIAPMKQLLSDREGAVRALHKVETKIQGAHRCFRLKNSRFIS